MTALTPTHPLVMRPHELVVIVYGLPAPQGSKRLVGTKHPMIVDDNKSSLRTWREDVKLAAMRAIRITPGWDGDYPLIVGQFTFTLPRPKGHYRTGKNAHLLRDDAPMLHGKRPDLDKLLRSTWDALTTAGAYYDDNRVARVSATKCYPSSRQVPAGALPRPGAWIHLQGAQR